MSSTCTGRELLSVEPSLISPSLFYPHANTVPRRQTQTVGNPGRNLHKVNAIHRCRNAAGLETGTTIADVAKGGS
jgi:hypothetical protein